MKSLSSKVVGDKISEGINSYFKQIEQEINELEAKTVTKVLNSPKVVELKR